MSYFILDLLRHDTNYTLETTDTGLPIHKIPFPAITICPETKAQKSMVNVTEAYRKLKVNDKIDYGEEE